MIASRNILSLLVAAYSLHASDAFAPIAPRSTMMPSSAAAAVSPTKLNVFNGIELAGLLYDNTSTAFDAWEWCVSRNEGSCLRMYVALRTPTLN